MLSITWYSGEYTADDLINDYEKLPKDDVSSSFLRFYKKLNYSEDFYKWILENKENNNNKLLTEEWSIDLSPEIIELIKKRSNLNIQIDEATSRCFCNTYGKKFAILALIFQENANSIFTEKRIIEKPIQQPIKKSIDVNTLWTVIIGFIGFMIALIVGICNRTFMGITLLATFIMFLIILNYKNKFFLDINQNNET